MSDKKNVHVGQYERTSKNGILHIVRSHYRTSISELATPLITLAIISALSVSVYGLFAGKAAFATGMMWVGGGALGAMLGAWWIGGTIDLIGHAVTRLAYLAVKTVGRVAGVGFGVYVAASLLDGYAGTHITVFLGRLVGALIGLF